MAISHRGVLTRVAPLTAAVTALLLARPATAVTCGAIINVGKSGQPFTTIQGGVNAIPISLAADYCVVVRDTQTYSEQVTVSGKSTNNFKITIMSDESFVSSSPVVNPPQSSTAAFRILVGSVTIQNFLIASTNTVTYGVFIGTADVTLSSITVVNTGSTASVLLSTRCALTTSYIDAGTYPAASRVALEIMGASATVTGSTMTGTGGAYLVGLSSAVAARVSASSILHSGQRLSDSSVVFVGRRSAFSRITGSTIRATRTQLDYQVDNIYIYGATGTIVSGNTLTSIESVPTLATGVYLEAANKTTISSCTIMPQHATGWGVPNYDVVGIYVSRSSNTTVEYSTATGLSSLRVTHSTNTTAAYNDFYSSDSDQYTVSVFNGSRILDFHDNRLNAPPNPVVGVFISKALNSSVRFTSNTLRGYAYSLYITTQSGGSAVYITSNTFLPSGYSGGDQQIITLWGLANGATVQDNDFYHRFPANLAGNISFGFFARDSAKLVIKGNRFSQPNMYSNASLYSLALSNVDNTSIEYNDFRTTTSGVGFEHIRLRDGSTNILIRHNAFYSLQATVGISSVPLRVFADSQAGFRSDHNLFYGPAGVLMGAWGDTGSEVYCRLPGWLGCSGGPSGLDQSSKHADPHWAATGAGNEDFHPRSSAGRYDPTTQTFTTDPEDSGLLDAAAPSESYAFEPFPTGNQANIGSYGNTVEASKTPFPACPITRQINRSTGPYVTISGAVSALPTILPGAACLYVNDSSTYPEQVTLRNLTGDGFRVLLAGTKTSPPVLTPPAGSTAAVLVALSSVTLQHLQITPSATVNYGVRSSSAYTEVTSVTVSDMGSVAVAGISLSSYSTVRYTAATVVNAVALQALAAPGLSVINSTATNNSTNRAAVHASTSVSVSFLRANVYNSVGRGALLVNSPSFSFAYSSISAASGMLTVRSASGTIAASYLSGTTSYALTLATGSYQTNVTGSTFSSVASGFAALEVAASTLATISRSNFYNTLGPALRFSGSSSSTLVDSLLRGATALMVTDSTSTVVGGSVLVATGTLGAALWAQDGNVSLRVTTSTIIGGRLGSAAFFDRNNTGLLHLTSSTLRGSPVGVRVSTQATGARFVSQGNLILPELISGAMSAGILLNGLSVGATIQSDSIYYRTPGLLGAATAYGLRAVSSPGLVFDNNRVGNPGMVLSGAFEGLSLADADRAMLRYNDVHSTGTGFTNHYLLRVDNASIGVRVRGGVFSSSGTASGTFASVLVSANSQSGYDADYNDWISSSAFHIGVWGVTNLIMLPSWRASSGQDLNSISTLPLWAATGAGAEDYHPYSSAGRYDPDTQGFVVDGVSAATIDTGDSVDGVGLETEPNGFAPNQGSYGRTAEASRSAPEVCPVTRRVHQTDGPFTNITAAVDSLPNPLPGHACIHIEDGATYAEEVAVLSLDAAGSSLTIRPSPGNPLRPVIAPPAGSTAAVRISASSVTLYGIDLSVSAAVPYGIKISSPFVTISSVSLVGTSALYTAGIELVGYSTVSYTSVNLGGTADGLRLLNGTASQISASTIVTMGLGVNAFNADGSTLSFVFVSAGGGVGVSYDALTSSPSVSHSSVSASADGLLMRGSRLLVQDSHVDGLDLRNSVDGLVIRSTVAGGVLLSSASDRYELRRTMIYMDSTNVISISSGSDDVVISSCSVFGSYSSILSCSNSARLLVENSTFSTTGAIFAPANSFALSLTGCSTATLRSVYVQGSADGVKVSTSARATLLGVTAIVPSGGNGNLGLYLYRAGTTTISGGSFTGPSAALRVDQSTNTIARSAAFSASGGAAAVYINTNSRDFFLVDSTVTSTGASAHGVFVASQARGTIELSSNAIAAGLYAVRVDTPTAGYTVHISSNLLVGGVSSAADSGGLQLNALVSGATVQYNSIYLRASGSSGAQTTYGARVQGSNGLVFRGNRVNNPGMLTGGSFTGLHLQTVTGAQLLYNDLHSTGTGLTNAYLVRLVSATGVKIRGAVHSSSVTVGGSALTLAVDAASQSGFSSDYNDFHSSNSSLGFAWGAAGPVGLPAWQAASLQDANSISAHPRWPGLSAGTEDFHPLSSKGRYAPASGAFVLDSVDSPTIDLGDPIDDFSRETAPNGSRINVGSYGNTLEASRSNALCPLQRNVGGGQAYPTIQAAVDSLPALLTSNVCVVIHDAATYAEQVEVRNRTNNGFRIEIENNPELGLRPVVAPPAGSTAAFVVANDSVSIINIDVMPSAALTYGILISSAHARLISDQVLGGALIWSAGVSLSSWARVENATISVTAAYALRASGAAGVVVERSTTIGGGTSLPAVLFDASTGASLNASYVRNDAGPALVLAGVSALSVTASTLSAAAGSALNIAGSTSTRVSDSILTASAGSALSVSSGSLDVLISGSNLISAAGAAASVTDSSGTWFSGSVLSGADGLTVLRSSQTAVAGSILSAASGAALDWDSGRDLSVASSTLSGAARGARVARASGGAIDFSSNTVSGRVAVEVSTALVGATIWVTSNTLLPAPSPAGDAAGLIFDTLASGATAWGNAVYFRVPGSVGTFAAYGLRVLAAPGAVLAHNRVNNPGQVTGGSFAGIALSDADAAQLLYNDVHSSGTALTNAALLLLESGSTDVRARNNIFASSHVASGDNFMVFVDAPSQTGLVSDYNDWYSSNSVFSGSWGGATLSLLAAWRATSGRDLNSVSTHPRWRSNSAGTEDFHPLSMTGRYDPTAGVFVLDMTQSDTVDVADPADAFADETAPNNGRANLGAYGGTTEASRSAPALTSVALSQVAVSSIAFSYGTISFSDGYRVDASTAADFSGTLHSSASAAASSLWLTSLTPNTSYFLRAGVFYGANTRFTAAVPPSTTTWAASPGAPISGSPGAGSIGLTWNTNGNPPGTLYQAQVSTDGFATLVASSDTLSLSTTYFGMVGNLSYQQRVRAVNYRGVPSIFATAAPLETLPNPPTGTTILTLTSATVTLSWSPNGNIDPGTTYRVWIDVDPGFLTPLTYQTLSYPVTITGLSPATLYYFRVQALAISGAPSAFDAVVSTLTLPPTPGMPGTPAPVPLSPTEIAWTWSPAVFASSYSLRIASDAATILASPTGPSALLTGLSTNTAYGAVVIGHNASALGPLSGSATAYTLAAPATGTAVTLLLSTTATYAWGLNTNPPYTIASVERSTDDLNYQQVFSGSQSTFTDAGLIECTTYYTRVRNRNGDGVPTAYDATMVYKTPGVLASPPVGFSGQSLAGQLVSFSWLAPPASNLELYRLYWDAGTQTVDYGTPLAVIASTATSYTTGVLPSSATYRFVLRAVSCAVEETTGSTVLAASTPTLTTVRAAVRSPASGLRVRGNRVTVAAELTSGSFATTSQVRFQYRAAAASLWNDMVPSGAGESNPDSAPPFFVHWDADALPPGAYELRAIAQDLASTADDAAAVVSIILDPIASEHAEYLTAGKIRHERAVYNAVDNALWTASAGNAMLKIVLPANSLSTSSTTLTVINDADPPAGPPSGYAPGGLYTQIDLSNGQTALVGGRTASLTLSYPDANGDARIDGGALEAKSLHYFSYDPASSRWLADLVSAADPEARTITAFTPHFSVFAAFATQTTANLDLVRVYPVPFKPNGVSPDEGRPYSAADPFSGIVFDNLPAAVTIKIYDLSGQLVRKLSTTDSLGVLRWDAHTDSGHLTASGVYFAVISSPVATSVVKRLSIVR